MDRAGVDYLPGSARGRAKLRLTFPRGEETAEVMIPFSALRVVAIGLKSDDERSMRTAFERHAFALNAKLSARVSLLRAGEIVLVTPAMLRK
jgi:hypothetical protein